MGVVEGVARPVVAADDRLAVGDEQLAVQRRFLRVELHLDAVGGEALNERPVDEEAAVGRPERRSPAREEAARRRSPPRAGQIEPFRWPRRSLGSASRLRDRQPPVGPEHALASAAAEPSPEPRVHLP